MSEITKKDLRFGKHVMGYGGAPRRCDKCGEYYIPQGWEKQITSIPETFPRIDFLSKRCCERSFEVCDDCLYEIMDFIEKNEHVKKRMKNEDSK